MKKLERTLALILAFCCLFSTTNFAWAVEDMTAELEAVAAEAPDDAGLIALAAEDAAGGEAAADPAPAPDDGALADPASAPEADTDPTPGQEAEGGDMPASEAPELQDGDEADELSAEIGSDGAVTETPLGDGETGEEPEEPEGSYVRLTVSSTPKSAELVRGSVFDVNLNVTAKDGLGALKIKILPATGLKLVSVTLSQAARNRNFQQVAANLETNEWSTFSSSIWEVENETLAVMRFKVIDPDNLAEGETAEYVTLNDVSTITIDENVTAAKVSNNNGTQLDQRYSTVLIEPGTQYVACKCVYAEEWHQWEDLSQDFYLDGEGNPTTTHYMYDVGIGSDEYPAEPVNGWFYTHPTFQCSSAESKVRACSVPGCDLRYYDTAGHVYVEKGKEGSTFVATADGLDYYFCTHCGALFTLGADKAQHTVGGGKSELRGDRSGEEGTAETGMASVGFVWHKVGDKEVDQKSMLYIFDVDDQLLKFVGDGEITKEFVDTLVEGLQDTLRAKKSAIMNIDFSGGTEGMYIRESAFTGVYSPRGEEHVKDLFNGVTINGGVIDIEAHAFEGSFALSNLVLNTEDGNFKLRSIGEKAFYDCRISGNITFPACVKTIGAHAFDGENTYHMMYGINIEGENVVIDEYAFAHGATEGSVTIGNGAIIKTNAFLDAALDTFKIGNDAKIADGAFTGCADMESMTIGDNAKIGDGSTPGSDPVGPMEGCASLEELRIGANAVIAADAFKGCSSLETLYIGGGTVSIATGAFTNVATEADECVVAIGITYDDYGSPAVDDEDNYIFASDCAITIARRAFAGSGVTNLVIGPNAAVAADALINNKNLVAIYLGDNDVVEAGAFTGSGTAGSQEGLVLTLGENVTLKDGSFSGSTGLTAVNAGENAVIGGSAFTGVPTLQTVTIANGGTIGDGAFKGCAALTAVTIGNGVTIGDGSSLTKGNTVAAGVFQGCTALTDVTIGRNATIGGNAFEGDTGLTSIIIGGGTTTIENGAFAETGNMPTAKLNVVIGAKVDETGAPVMNGADYTLEEAVGEPDNYTSPVLLIKTHSFLNSDVTTLTIGHNATVQTEAFKGCDWLELINIGDDAKLGNGSFAGVGTLSQTGGTNINIGNNADIGDKSGDGGKPAEGKVTVTTVVTKEVQIKPARYYQDEVGNEYVLQIQETQEENVVKSYTFNLLSTKELVPNVNNVTPDKILSLTATQAEKEAFQPTKLTSMKGDEYTQVTVVTSPEPGTITIDAPKTTSVPVSGPLFKDGKNNEYVQELIETTTDGVTTITANGTFRSKDTTAAPDVIGATGPAADGSWVKGGTILRPVTETVPEQEEVVIKTPVKGDSYWDTDYHSNRYVQELSSAGVTPTGNFISQVEGLADVQGAHKNDDGTWQSGDITLEKVTGKVVTVPDPNDPSGKKDYVEDPDTGELVNPDNPSDILEPVPDKDNPTGYVPKGNDPANTDPAAPTPTPIPADHVADKVPPTEAPVPGQTEKTDADHIKGIPYGGTPEHPDYIIVTDDDGNITGDVVDADTGKKAGTAKMVDGKIVVTIGGDPTTGEGGTKDEVPKTEPENFDVPRTVSGDTVIGGLDHRKYIVEIGTDGLPTGTVADLETGTVYDGTTVSKNTDTDPARYLNLPMHGKSSTQPGTGVNTTKPATGDTNTEIPVTDPNTGEPITEPKTVTGAKYHTVGNDSDIYIEVFTDGVAILYPQDTTKEPMTGLRKDSSNNYRNSSGAIVLIPVGTATPKVDPEGTTAFEPKVETVNGDRYENRKDPNLHFIEEIKTTTNEDGTVTKEATGRLIGEDNSLVYTGMTKDADGNYVKSGTNIKLYPIVAAEQSTGGTTIEEPITSPTTVPVNVYTINGKTYIDQLDDKGQKTGNLVNKADATDILVPVYDTDGKTIIGYKPLNAPPAATPMPTPVPDTEPVPKTDVIQTKDGALYRDKVNTDNRYAQEVTEAGVPTGKFISKTSGVTDITGATANADGTYTAGSITLEPVTGKVVTVPDPSGGDPKEYVEDPDTGELVNPDDPDDILDPVGDPPTGYVPKGEDPEDPDTPFIPVEDVKPENEKEEDVVTTDKPVIVKVTGGLFENKTTGDRYVQEIEDGTVYNFLSQADGVADIKNATANGDGSFTKNGITLTPVMKPQTETITVKRTVNGDLYEDGSTPAKRYVQELVSENDGPATPSGKFISQTAGVPDITGATQVDENTWQAPDNTILTKVTGKVVTVPDPSGGDPKEYVEDPDTGDLVNPDDPSDILEPVGDPPTGYVPKGTDPEDPTTTPIPAGDVTDKVPSTKAPVPGTGEVPEDVEGEVVTVPDPDDPEHPKEYVKDPETGELIPKDPGGDILVPVPDKDDPTGYIPKGEDPEDPTTDPIPAEDVKPKDSDEPAQGEVEKPKTGDDGETIITEPTSVTGEVVVVDDPEDPNHSKEYVKDPDTGELIPRDGKGDILVPVPDKDDPEGYKPKGHENDPNTHEIPAEDVEPKDKTQPKTEEVVVHVPVTKTYEGGIYQDQKHNRYIQKLVSEDEGEPAPNGDFISITERVPDITGATKVPGSNQWQAGDITLEPVMKPQTTEKTVPDPDHPGENKQIEGIEVSPKPDATPPVPGYIIETDPDSGDPTGDVIDPETGKKIGTAEPDPNDPSKIKVTIDPENPGDDPITDEVDPERGNEPAKGTVDVPETKTTTITNGKIFTDGTDQFVEELEDGVSTGRLLGKTPCTKIYSGMKPTTPNASGEYSYVDDLDHPTITLKPYHEPEQGSATTTETTTETIKGEAYEIDGKTYILKPDDESDPDGNGKLINKKDTTDIITKTVTRDEDGNIIAITYTDRTGADVTDKVSQVITPTGAFEGSNSKDVNVGDDANLGDNSFKDNKNMDNFDAGKNTENIGEGALSGTGAGHIGFGDNDEGKETHIGDNAITDNDNLDDLDLGDGTTTIGEGGISGNGNLKDLNLPDSLKDIGEGGLDNENLENLTGGDGLNDAIGDKDVFGGSGKGVNIIIGTNAKGVTYKDVFAYIDAKLEGDAADAFEDSIYTEADNKSAIRESEDEESDIIYLTDLQLKNVAEWKAEVAANALKDKIAQSNINKNGIDTNEIEGYNEAIAERDEAIAKYREAILKRDAADNDADRARFQAEADEWERKAEAAGQKAEDLYEAYLQKLKDDLKGEMLTYRPGDVNIDSVVNLVDALDAARYELGDTDKISAAGLKVGDVNQDGYLNVRDAMVIAMYMVGKVTSLPILKGTV